MVEVEIKRFKNQLENAGREWFAYPFSEEVNNSRDQARVLAIY